MTGPTNRRVNSILCALCLARWFVPTTAAQTICPRCLILTEGKKP